jgi:hypothetical protein
MKKSNSRDYHALSGMEKVAWRFPWRKSTQAVAILVVMLLSSIACNDGYLDETDLLDETGAKGSALPQTNRTELDMPITVTAEVTTYDCSNNPGPRIYFSGLATTAGFGVRTIFRNNMKGTHEHIEEALVDATLQPAGSEIVIPKQPVRGGVGGNPFIWVQFYDEDGNPVSGEIFIGRCVQGYTFKMSQNMSASAVGTSKYKVEGCANSPGPNITFDASLSMAGLNAKLIFRNNDNKVGGPHEAQATLSDNLEVIPSGISWTFPKQPVLGGVGGNPWIWTQFLNGHARAVSDEILLGRCEQLSKALSSN